MSRNINSITDVVEAQLCTGCGACSYIENERFRMADTFEYGRRPFLRDGAPAETGEALAACPGVVLGHPVSAREQAGVIQELFDAWGPVLGVWEGYATDQEIRYSGSSGGAATALALYCLEQSGMAGVLHTAARGAYPYLNETVLSTSRSELLSRTGSRYAPSSPLDALWRVEQAPAPCVFIGKPCDVAAVANVQAARPVLSEKLGMVLAFFCAGVPSIKGNIELLRANGIDDLSKLKELRYRGNGWPGLWTARHVNAKGEEEVRQMTYADSWGFLQKSRQWRCYICPDHSGEFADIAVGDPWYRPVQPGEPGKSLIVARTQRGLEIVKAAEKAGYLCLETEDASLLPRSQPNLLSSRGELWARLKVLGVLGAGVPRYAGFGFFRFWLSQLGLIQKLRSLSGTFKRVYLKQLNKRNSVIEWHPD